MFYLHLIYGNLCPNQLVGLGDGHERIHDKLNAELISMTVRPVVNPGREWCEDDGLFKWIDWFQVGICSALGAVTPPVMPILLCSFSSFRSDSIGNWPPHKKYITRDSTFDGNWYSFRYYF